MYRSAPVTTVLVAGGVLLGALASERLVEDVRWDRPSVSLSAAYDECLWEVDLALAGDDGGGEPREVLVLDDASTVRARTPATDRPSSDLPARRGSVCVLEATGAPEDLQEAILDDDHGVVRWGDDPTFQVTWTTTSAAFSATIQRTGPDRTQG